MGQLTQTTGAINMQYTYSATQNNGRITQSVDGRTGETVSYQYDALNRLIHAETADTTWGESYQYDQFGNLLLKTPTKGTAPAWAASYDPATNRQYGVSYDANGNPSAGYAWNVENRLVTQTSPDGAWRWWAYDPWGKRVARLRSKDGELDTWVFTMYGVTGQRMAEMQCQFSDSGHPYTPVCQLGMTWRYFGGRLMFANGDVAEDRLGSVGTYWPYGEERTQGQGEGAAFGTYWRDWPGQDYADQRYYNSASGRFMTPDPLGVRAAVPSAPETWNRYTYAAGDPVNFGDATGGCIDDGWVADSLLFPDMPYASWPTCSPHLNPCVSWEVGFMPTVNPVCYLPMAALMTNEVHSPLTCKFDNAEFGAGRLLFRPRALRHLGSWFLSV